MGFLRRHRRPARATRPPGVIDCGEATTAGRRPDNQDRCAVSQRWAVVSDGMGGYAGGQRAARITVDTAVASLDSVARAVDDAAGRRLLGRVVERANAAVRAARQADPAVASMGATLTMAAATSVLPEASTWLIANVGDSPAWLVTPEGCRQVTEDHSLAAELVRSGAISPREAATHPGQHVVTRAVGSEDSVAPDTTSVTLEPGDALVIASDGVSDVLGPDHIRPVVIGAPDATRAARRLVEKALRAGTTDNITAVVVRHLASSGDGPVR